MTNRRSFIYVVLALACGAGPTDIPPVQRPVTTITPSREYLLEAVNGRPVQAGGQRDGIVVGVSGCVYRGNTGVDSLSVGPGGTVTYGVAGEFDLILITHTHCYVNGQLAVFQDNFSLVQGSYEVAGDSLRMRASRAPAKVRGGAMGGEFSRTSSPTSITIRPEWVSFTVEDVAFGRTYTVRYVAQP